MINEFTQSNREEIDGRIEFSEDNLSKIIWRWTSEGSHCNFHFIYTFLLVETFAETFFKIFSQSPSSFHRREFKQFVFQGQNGIHQIDCQNHFQLWNLKQMDMTRVHNKK